MKDILFAGHAFSLLMLSHPLISTKRPMAGTGWNRNMLLIVRKIFL